MKLKVLEQGSSPGNNLLEAGGNDTALEMGRVQFNLASPRGEPLAAPSTLAELCCVCVQSSAVFRAHHSSSDWAETPPVHQHSADGGRAWGCPFLLK